MIQSINAVNNSTYAPNTQAPTAAPAEGASAKPRFDISQLEFKVVFEVKGQESALARPVAKLAGWSATQCPSDCSHGKLGDTGNGSYVRVQSPPLRLGNGGLEQLTKIIDIVKQNGASIGPTGAMRFYVPRNVMDDKATTNFMKIHLQNEDLLYLLGQHGGVGRQLDHKLGYCYSLSRYAANGADRVASQLSSHYNAVNSETNGYWEMRYFDTTFDADALKASAQLVCGMVGAAIDGRGTWNEMHAPVVGATPDRKRWNAFMRETVSPEVRRKLEANLRGAGGTVPKGLSNEAEKAITQLMSRQYAFENAEGKPFGSIENLADAVADSAAVTVRDPQGVRFAVPGEKLEMYAFAETGATKELPQEMQSTMADAAALRVAGVDLRDDKGTSMSPVRVALLDAQSKITVASGNETMTIGVNQLSNLRALQSGDQQSLKADVNSLMAALPSLQKLGYSFHDNQQPQVAIAWPAKIATTYTEGRLSLQRNAAQQNVPSWDAMERNVLFPERLATLPNDSRQLVEDAATLGDKGFAFAREGQAAPANRTVAFVDCITGDPTKLTVCAPGAPKATPLSSPGLLNTFVNIELGRDAQLDEMTRTQLALIDGLRAKGYTFYNLATEDEIKTRSGAPLTLQTDGQRLTMKPPDAKRRTRVTENALHNVLALEQGQLQNMRASLRDAVKNADSLRSGGFTLQMSDIAKEGEFIECSNPELVATLARKRPLGIVDPTGHRTVVSEGGKAFNAAVAEIQKTGALTPEQTQDVTRLQALIDQKRVAIRTQGEGAVEVGSAALLPWYFVHQRNVEMRPSSEQPEQSVKVEVSGWDGLKRALDHETRDTALTPAASALLERFSALRSKGVKFYTVAAKDQAKPIVLNGAFVDRLAAKDVQARLPRLSWWGWHPTRNVSIGTEADIEKLAHKFAGDPVKEAAV